MKSNASQYLQIVNAGWSEQKAHEWYEEQGWIVGCNYIPATAVNQLEMWQEETFDPFTIDKELSWAASLGFNTVRVFLHHLVWQQDAQAYLRRIDFFLSIAAKHNIKTMLVLFDSVWDPYPRAGRQPLAKTNIHNSGWVQCPGFDILNNPNRYDELYSYVHGIIHYFKEDERVLVWDLFNEPDNMNMNSYKDDYYSRPKEELCLLLLQKTLQWARTINPMQPLTMAPWKWVDLDSLSLLDQYMFRHSDIISFHCYEGQKGMEERILSLKAYNRPLICSEYMARGLESTFEAILPLLKAHKVAAYNWGFVQGKSQTHCPWDSWQTSYAEEPRLWFHDIFRPNGEPYNHREVDFLKAFNRKQLMQIQKVA